MKNLYAWRMATILLHAKIMQLALKSCLHNKKHNCFLRPSSFVLLLVILLGFSNNSMAITRYVKAGNATNTGGFNWESASGDLYTIINSSYSGDIIWVASGTYYTTSATIGSGATARDNAYVLKAGVKIYGGFAGTETTLAQRTPATMAANGSILSGDLNQNDGANFTNNADNSYHVVISSGDVGTAVLDGFTIKGGNASGEFTTITVNNNPISRFKGGGIVVESSAPMLRNITITSCSASYGGAISFVSSSAQLTSAMLSGNQSTNVGGGIFISAGAPIIANVLIANNYGRGVYVESSATPTFTNLTITGNIGSGITTNVTSPFNIYNGIVYNNTTGFDALNGSAVAVFKNSLVQGSASTTNGNISGSTDPLFVSAATGNYSLKTTSPVIDKGNDTIYAVGKTPNLSAINTDAAGYNRFKGLMPDMGAYEVQAASTYYSKATGFIDSLATWGTNTDGTGHGPSDFTSNSQIFTMVNQSSTSPVNSWTVAGTGSKVVIGDGIHATRFVESIASIYFLPTVFTGTVDVTALSTFSSTSSTPTLGTLASTSTVEFAGNNQNQTIPINTYGNLTVLGNNVATTAGTGLVVMGNFTENNSNNGSLSIQAPFTVVGNFSHLSGSIYNYSMDGSTIYITVKGNIAVNTAASANNYTSCSFIIAGSSVQTISVNAANISSTITVNSGSSLKLGSDIVATNNGYIIINVKGTLDVGSYILKANSLVLAVLQGGKLITANANGLAGINAAGNNLNTSYSNDAVYEFQGAATGVFNTIPAPYTVKNLIINNTSGSVTASQPFNVSGVLVLTNGILNTTVNNTVTITNTATTAITGGSTTTFVNGPLAWQLPASLSSSSAIYNFPVGVTNTYLPYSITNVNTGFTSPILNVMGFMANTGGAQDNSTTSDVSTTEYWQTTVTSGTYSGASLSLSRQTTLVPNFESIGKGSSPSSPAGIYSNLGGTVSGSSVTKSNQTGAIATGASQFNAFVSNLYFLSSAAVDNGSISPSGTMKVSVGNSQTFTITPKACYTIARVMVDGANNPAAISSGSYTFTGISASHSIIATFTPIGNCCTSNAGATIRN